MQLTKPKSIRMALAAATCSVLGTANAAAPISDNWDMKTTLLSYIEKDRVSVFAPGVIATKAIGEDKFVTITGVLDTITGASPTGAAPGSGGNCGTDNLAGMLCVTSPSGGTFYTSEGALPVKSFNDTRASLSIDWDQPLSRLERNRVTGSISAESDYFSLGLSDTYTSEFNNRHTTLALGAGITLDTISPQGGAPTAMTPFSAPVTVTSASGGESEGEQKNTINLLMGITQVINRRTLIQLNYSHALSSGYMNDPYKYLSIIDATSGQTIDYLHEGRPEERNSNVLYHLPEDVVHASVRLYSDDWGVNSTTFDLHYRYELGGGFYLKPHLRLYNQSAANFYRHSLVDGVDVNLASQTVSLANASADMRLAQMQSTTWGLKLGMPIGHGEKKGELSLRVEQMVQSGDSSPSDAIGVQQNYNMYPDLKAAWVQLNYSFTF
jgi:hypothetical protein